MTHENESSRNNGVTTATATAPEATAVELLGIAQPVTGSAIVKYDGGLPVKAAMEQVQHFQLEVPDCLTPDQVKTIQEGVAKLIAVVRSTDRDLKLGELGLAIGGEAMKSNSQHSKLLDAKMSEVLKAVAAEEGNPVDKTLLDIKAQLDQINPAVLKKEGLKGWLYYLTFTLAKGVPSGKKLLRVISERKETVYSTITGLQHHLQGLMDREIESAAEIETLADRMAKVEPALRTEIYRAELIFRGLKEVAAETDPATKPVKRQVLDQVCSDISQQIMDLGVVLQLNTQTRLGSEQIIRNSKLVRRNVERVRTILLPAVANALMVKVAAQRQIEAMQVSKDIMGAAQEAILDAAASTKEATVQVGELNKSSLVSVDALETACGDYLEAIAQFERIRSETEVAARTASEKLQGLNHKLGEKAAALTESREAQADGPTMGRR